MKATITRAALAEAAQAVKGLVAKDALSAFSKVRLDVSGCLSVTGSNGDVQVEWRMDGGWIGTQGTVTVPGTAFAAFVGALPDGDVEISAEGTSSVKSKVRMSSQDVVFRLAAGDAADFPVMKGPVVGSQTDLDAALMKEMLRKVMYAVSTDGTRAVLNGVNIALADGKLEMTATDGRRLAHVEKEVDGLAERSSAIKSGFNFTLPSKAAKALYALLEGMDGGDVTVVSDSASARFVGERFALTAKVAADVYPNWHQVVPEKVAHGVEIDRTQFLEALGRVALAADVASGVKIEIGGGKMVFEAKSDITSAKAEIAPVKTEDGVKAKIRINPRLLADALGVIDDDAFTFSWNDGFSPVKLTCSVPWVAVVMPYTEG